jgi:hypothetical protein
MHGIDSNPAVETRLRIRRRLLSERIRGWKFFDVFTGRPGEGITLPWPSVWGWGVPLEWNGSHDVGDGVKQQEKEASREREEDKYTGGLAMRLGPLHEPPYGAAPCTYLVMACCCGYLGHLDGEPVVELLY